MLGAAKLTKNADISKYKYSWYGIKFDRKVASSHPSSGFDKNTVIFGVGNYSKNVLNWFSCD